MAQLYLVDKLTPLDPEPAIRALCRAMIQLDQVLPTPRTLCCHVAQSALETGHWGKGWGGAMHWHNFGNVKASGSYNGDVTFFGCNEVLQRKVHWFHPTTQWGWPGHNQWVAKHASSVPNDNQCRWRAYQTPELGALEQMTFLGRRSGYSMAWAAATSGDPAAFSRALKSCRYYTADVGQYTRTLVSVFARYLDDCERVVAAIGAERARPVDPVREPDVPDSHDANKAERLCDGWLQGLQMAVDWDEHAATVRAAVLATE